MRTDRHPPGSSRNMATQAISALRGFKQGLFLICEEQQCWALWICNRYLGALGEFAGVGDKMYVRVNGVDDEGRLSLGYVAREKDRPKPPNRRERRRAERAEGGPAGKGELSLFIVPPCAFMCVPVCVCLRVCVCLCLFFILAPLKVLHLAWDVSFTEKRALLLRRKVDDRGLPTARARFPPLLLMSSALV